MTTDIVLNGQSARSRGVVVAYVSDQQVHASEHERITQAEFARRLAALKDYEAGGLYDPRRHYPGHIYFVPGSTLTTEQAAALGIRGPDDLFGGVVPHAFVATKVISHPLVEPAAALPGWNRAFGAQVGDAVLAGYAAFNHDDARRAGLRLLESGPVRIKPVLATGGLGQSVARDAAELQRAARVDRPERSHVARAGARRESSERGPHLQRRSSEGRRSHGKLLRPPAPDAQQSGSGGLRRLRPDRRARRFRRLAGDRMTPPEIRCAIEQAQRYNAAVIACYPASSRRATTTTSSSAGTRRVVRARVCWNSPGVLAVPQAPNSPRSRSFGISPSQPGARVLLSRSSGRARRRPRMRPSISAATIRGPGG